MQYLRKLDWSRAARILCFVIGCYSLVEYIDFGDYSVIDITAWRKHCEMD